MIKEAFEQAERHKSGLSEDFVNSLTGLSSPKIWHLLNNLGKQSTSYLEIGTYLGSSLMAVLQGNDINAVAVDNFCMKPHLRNHFFQNMKPYKFTFIEKDCFEIDVKELPEIDFYFFDGEHTFESQYKALTHFVSAMASEFIFVCDDWNNTHVREATFQAIKDCNLEIVEFEERKNSLMKDKAGWWCGIFVAKLRRL